MGSRRALFASLALVLVLGVAVVGVWLLRDDDSRFTAAASLAPEETARITWVDWAAVRHELDAADQPVTSLVRAAFEADLSSPSVLTGRAEVIDAEFGFSPRTLDWELMAQSTHGAVLLLGLDDPDAVDRVGTALSEIGFTRPADAVGLWRGGPTVIAQLDAGLSPMLQYAVLFRDRRLVMFGDRAQYVEEMRTKFLDGHTMTVGESLAAAGDPVAAVHLVGDLACTSLSMHHASADDQEAARSLIAEAGRVNPLQGLVVAAQPGGGLRVAFEFESAEQARANADSRSRLAQGPAPGKGGAWPFTVEGASSSGVTARLDLTPTERYAFSAISNGPVLFATC
ncbi:hypothetical protein [Nocardioides limicola]|uniref:hypothetical protein n=1 Tax=Nocardioides limicola TaxID=2803368 RepID=UPI00193BC471|nr:hypothetical protein [Nocardioides sp. DJM-14]